MQYTVEKIESGIATIRFSDQSWAEIALQVSMTEQDLDDLVHQFAPKTGSVPDFLSVGQERVAKPKPTAPPVSEEHPDSDVHSVEPILNPMEDEWAQYDPANQPGWLKSRKEAYGSVFSQIEFITEHGLQAWQEHVREIKGMFPKPPSPTQNVISH